MGFLHQREKCGLYAIWSTVVDSVSGQPRACAQVCNSSRQEIHLRDASQSQVEYKFNAGRVQAKRRARSKISCS
ncbi:MAG: hypothetical protein CBE43_05130 [Rhodopirellula sp. TMED283]|nr:MAG: hypothetical protein CBE43_05130 [Rhodopirellula sp. TMED283]